MWAREGLSHGHHRLHVRLFVLACQVCVKRGFVRFIKVEASSWVLRTVGSATGSEASIQRSASGGYGTLRPFVLLIVLIHRPFDSCIQRSFDRLDCSRDSGVDGLALPLGRPSEDVFYVTRPSLGSSDADAHAGELLGA